MGDTDTLTSPNAMVKENATVTPTSILQARTNRWVQTPPADLYHLMRHAQSGLMLVQRPTLVDAEDPDLVPQALLLLLRLSLPHRVALGDVGDRVLTPV